MKRALLLLGLVTLCFAAPYSGCFEGGATFNQKAPGNNDSGGVNLGGYKDPNGDGRKDIAVDPQGAYVLARMGDKLVVGDLVKGAVHTVDAVGIPMRVAFAEKARRFYVVVQGGHPRGVFAVDPKTRKVLWKHDVLDFEGAVRLYPSKDDKFLVVADHKRMRILDTKDGGMRAAFTPKRKIEDVDITPDSSRILVTQEFTRKGGNFNTRISIIEPVEGRSEEISVPNCSSPLVLTKDGSRAFLAPTQCGSDPVSVIDIKQRKFIKNLPGFGPVALAPGGDTAVAFLDRDSALDRDLFGDKSQKPSRSSDRYHLMFINTKTLKFTTVEVGDKLPRYAVSRDGKVVLVDSVWFGAKEEVRVVDCKFPMI